MPKFIDVHAHPNFAAFNADRDEVIRRALDAGIWLTAVGTQKDTSRKALELAEKYKEGVYAIVGLHPIHTGKSFHDEKELGEGGGEFTSRGETFDYEYYKKLAESPKAVAIGECGLDYFRLEEKSLKKQRENFSAQIALANAVRKPLMLHVRSGTGRSAYRDALEILKAEVKVKCNFHFFAGSWAEAKELLDFGCTLSFTGVITFTRDYDEAIKNTPLERIFSETDCPYVAPAPNRGKRNEPLFVREVVRRIAEIRGEEHEHVRSVLCRNAIDFFGLVA